MIKNELSMNLNKWSINQNEWSMNQQWLINDLTLNDEWI